MVRLASRPITSTAVGHTAHATVMRNVSSARTEMRYAMKGKRPEKSRKNV